MLLTRISYIKVHVVPSKRSFIIKNENRGNCNKNIIKIMFCVLVVTYDGKRIMCVYDIVKMLN